jgi:hypothetical protein
VRKFKAAPSTTLATPQQAIKHANTLSSSVLKWTQYCRATKNAAIATNITLRCCAISKSFIWKFALHKMAKNRLFRTQLAVGALLMTDSTRLHRILFIENDRAVGEEISEN